MYSIIGGKLYGIINIKIWRILQFKTNSFLYDIYVLNINEEGKLNWKLNACLLADKLIEKPFIFMGEVMGDFVWPVIR